MSDFLNDLNTTRLRAENEKLRAAFRCLKTEMREAFRFGFWSNAGPTNDAEFAQTEKSEEEAWDDWKTQTGRK